MDDERELQDPLTATGLLFSRVAIAAARVRDSQPPGPRDTRTFERVVEWLTDRSQWLRGVQVGGPAQTSPSFMSNDWTYGPWLDGEEPTDLAAIADALDALIGQVAVVRDGTKDMEVVTRVYETFRNLADRARAEAGTSGDSILVP
jgi:hypothetical protein